MTESLSGHRFDCRGSNQPCKRTKLQAQTVVHLLARMRLMQYEDRRRIVHCSFPDNFCNGSSSSFISMGVKFALTMKSSMVHKETYETERGPLPQFVQLILYPDMANLRH